MKTSELRIGNYISLKSRIAKIAEIFHKGILAYDLEETQDTIENLERLEPIPITEEWLLKFGFENKDDNRYEIWMHDHEDFEIEYIGKKYAYRIWCEDAPHVTHFIGHCKYVHELQNLFFCLRKKELTIK